MATPFTQRLQYLNLILSSVINRILRDHISRVAQVVYTAIGVVRLLKVEIHRPNLVQQDTHSQNSLALLLARFDYPYELIYCACSIPRSSQ